MTDHVDELLRRPSAFGFVEAVDTALASIPEPIHPGGDGPASRESVRMRPRLDLAFPVADVAEVVRLPPAADGSPRIRIETTFLGVYGQASPLPTYFTERLLADDGTAARDFIDIFHHRILSLAWRVMTKYRLRADGTLNDRMRAIAGSPSDLPRPRIAGGDIMAVAGLLARQPRSAAAMGMAISRWLGIQVDVEQCAPVWVDVPAERQARLGAANCGAGTDMLAGSRIFSRTTAFLVVAGPIGPDQLPRFLPGGDAMAAIEALVAECNPERLDWAVEVVIAGDAVAPTALDGSARLGWDARLDGTPPADLRIRISAT